MATHFIADVHLTAAADDPNARRLAGYLAGPARNADALYVLGDLFDVWIGDDGSLADHAATLDAFAACVASGVPGYFIRGNRDFAVGEAFVARSGLLILNDPEAIRVNDTAVVISHGDGLCTDDTAHQAFRARYTNPIWRARMLAIPLWARRALARMIRRRSSAGKARKRAHVMDVNAESVKATLTAHAAAHLVHGHTHRPADHELDVRGETAVRHVLADWRPEHAEVLVFDDDGVRRQALDADGGFTRSS